MSEIEWLRFIPFGLCSLMLLGWSLIVIIQTKRDDWDWLNVSLAGLGIVISLYMGSLALGYSRVIRDYPPGYYDAIRALIGLVSLIGIFPTYRNLWAVIKARWRDRWGGEDEPP